MAKLFVASVRCPSFSHTNHFDFQFYQRWGYERKLSTPLKHGRLDSKSLQVIDERLQKLTLFSQATSYSKQKDSLQKNLESFLGSLPVRCSLISVSPREICRFLVFKDRNERTQFHGNGCNFLGQRGIHRCGCPLRLSYKTVDSYIGNLRAIFHAFMLDLGPLWTSQWKIIWAWSLYGAASSSSTSDSILYW